MLIMGDFLRWHANMNYLILNVINFDNRGDINEKRNK